MSRSTNSSDNEDNKLVGGTLMQGSQRLQSIDLPQVNPFTKGRLLGAKNYAANENFVIIEAIARRKAHYSWRDENIWRSVAAEVSNSTAHERTPAQISDHFKKMVTAVRSAITELFVSSKMTWPARGSIDDEEQLHNDRLIYVSQLLQLMTNKSAPQSKKYFSHNWWSEAVLLRLVELINSDEGREYNTNDITEDYVVDSRSQAQIRGPSMNQYKRKRDDIRENEIPRITQQMGVERPDLLEDAINQISFIKHITDTLMQTVNVAANNNKLLESRIKELENSNDDMRRELQQIHELLKSLINGKDEASLPI